MISHASRAEIGGVGARLLYPDGRVQHQGVVVGLGGIAGHYLAFSKGSEAGPQDTLRHTRSVSAITGACLALRREVFEAAGGFDEQLLPIAYNDVDLCLRIKALGLRNLVTPHATLIHKESASRGDDLASGRRARWEQECAVMRSRWMALIEADPHFHPYLARVGLAPCLRMPPAGLNTFSPRDVPLSLNVAQVNAWSAHQQALASDERQASAQDCGGQALS
jgi:hypothetical protein